MVLPVLAAIMVLSSIGMNQVMAEQQIVVELPLDRPFTDTECQAWNLVDTNGEGKFRFSCFWDWSLDQAIRDTLTQLDVDLTEGKNYTSWLDEVLPLVENNPLIESLPEKEIPTDKSSITTPDAEQLIVDEQILDDFEKCFGGQEQAGAIQAEYSIQKFERLVKRFLSGDDKLAEECNAILLIRNYTNTAYPSLVVREDTSAKTIIPELKMSAGTQVTDEKLKTEAAVSYPAWYKNPYGDCIPRDETDTRCNNRGNSEPIISDRFDTFVGKSASSIYEEYELKKAADILTKQDIKNLNRELNILVCETAWKTSGLGGLDISKWRTFLADGWCNDKLDTVYFKGQQWKLEDVIAYKVEQSATETKQDLRTYK